jgi:hypothetical protein
VLIEPLQIDTEFLETFGTKGDLVKKNETKLVNDKVHVKDTVKTVIKQDQFAEPIDPAKALSRLRQADADWVMTNQVITPFTNNEKSVIQVLQIPPQPNLKDPTKKKIGWMIVVYEYK